MNSFEKGDLVQPKNGRVQSNYWTLYTIRKAKITYITKYTVDIKIIEGHSYNKQWNEKRSIGEIIKVRHNCLTMWKKKLFSFDEKQIKYSIW